LARQSLRPAWKEGEQFNLGGYLALMRQELQLLELY
jgi:hypothetical protein